MSTATQELPLEVVRLLAVPALDEQSEEQLRGAACVWDGQPLTAETAVQLGERRHRRLDGHYSTFPRGCASCVAERAHSALLAHGSSCGRCVSEKELCPVDTALHRLVREAQR